MAAKRPPKQQKSKNSGFFVGLFTMLATIAAIIFAIAIFFRVNEMTVTGNKMYTEEEILAASGLENGDNMLTIRKSEAASRILVELPYIAEVRIARSLPDRVRIEVRESDTAAAVESDVGEWWLVGTGGKVLEQIAQADAGKYMKLTGVELTAPETGRPMQLAAGTDDVIQLLGALEENGLQNQITSADVSSIYDMVLYYGQIYEIHIGGASEIGYKIRYLAAVLEELSQSRPGVAGTIDLTFSDEKVARFIERSTG